MIKIKMHQEKWQIVLGDEVWQFNERNEMEQVLLQLIQYKDKFGRGVR